VCHPLFDRGLIILGDMINGGHVGVPQVVDPQPGKPCRLDRWFHTDG
jgi:hypothetical protein